MKKLLYTILLIVLTTLTAQTQQIGMYSDFMMNAFYYSPAYAGSQEALVVNAGYRKQWAGFDNAPSNFHVNLLGSVKNKGKVGYGVGVYNESSGLMNITGIRLNYAHHFKLSENVKLGLGIQPGFFQYRIRLYDAIQADEGDDILSGNVYSTNAFDINMGFNLYSKKFFVMASAQRILGSMIKFTGFNSQLQFHFNAIAGYNFHFEKQKIELQPSILVRYTEPVPVQVSPMIKMKYDEKYSLGLLYRHDDAVAVIAGYTWNKRLSVAYGYDISINALRKYNSGSHEIMLSFILNNKKPTLEELDDKLNNSILEDTNKSSK
ncbi:MAG TPA: type IX secretion system membrane protein PorP/SprF [Brumimicrobium sp.]|nr:type IX secretion system membrane protein PorP/SprF [Brumimicrobium sp.]